LRRYQLYWPQEWDKVKASEFGPFVDPEVASELNDLQDRLLKTTDISNTSFRSAQRDIELGIDAFLGTGIDSHLRSDLINTFVQDQVFMFDPDGNRPLYPGNLRNALDQARRPEPEKDLVGLLTEVKRRLLDDSLIQTRVAECRSILEAAAAIHSRILKRMKDPFE
jgi:hypothetical protein